MDEVVVASLRPPWILLIIPVIGFILHTLYSLLMTKFTQHKMTKENGCQALRTYPHKDPFLGLDILWETFNRLKEGTSLEGNQNRFKLYGNTFQYKVFGKRSAYFSSNDSTAS
jgi:hypothetical protein